MAARSVARVAGLQLEYTTSGTGEVSSQSARSAPMPRRGGFTIATSGLVTTGAPAGDPETDAAEPPVARAPSGVFCRRAQLVASSARKRTSRPSAAAASLAPSMACAEDSTPVTCAVGSALATCSAKPPSPQYRSHTVVGELPAIQAAACRYSCPATSVLVCRNDCALACSVTSPVRTAIVEEPARGISTSPSTAVVCAGWMFALTPTTEGWASSRRGRCSRIRGSAFSPRSTRRTRWSPSGDAVISTFLISPRRRATSYGGTCARRIRVRTPCSTASTPGGYSGQSERSAVLGCPGRPSTGAAAVPATAIFPRERNPASGPTTGSSQTPEPPDAFISA